MFLIQLKENIYQKKESFIFTVSQNVFNFVECLDIETPGE